MLVIVMTTQMMIHEEGRELWWDELTILEKCEWAADNGEFTEEETREIDRWIEKRFHVCKLLNEAVEGKCEVCKEEKNLTHYFMCVHNEMKMHWVCEACESATCFVKDEIAIGWVCMLDELKDEYDNKTDDESEALKDNGKFYDGDDAPNDGKKVKRGRKSLVNADEREAVKKDLFEAWGLDNVKMRRDRVKAVREDAMKKYRWDQRTWKNVNDSLKRSWRLKNGNRKKSESKKRSKLQEDDDVFQKSRTDKNYHTFATVTMKKIREDFSTCHSLEMLKKARLSWLKDGQMNYEVNGINDAFDKRRDQLEPQEHEEIVYPTDISPISPNSDFEERDELSDKEQSDSVASEDEEVECSVDEEEEPMGDICKDEELMMRLMRQHFERVKDNDKGLKRRLKEVDESNKRLKMEKDEMGKKLTDVNSVLENRIKDNENKNAKIVEVNRENEELKKKLKELEAENEKLAREAEENKAIATEANQLKEKIEELEKCVEEKRSRYEKLKEMNNKAVMTMNERVANMKAQHTKELQLKDQRINALIHELDVLKSSALKEITSDPSPGEFDDFLLPPSQTE